MTRRRLPFNTADVLNANVLFEGEVATDVTTFRFRIGDGVTAGGVPQARLDEVLARTLRDGSNLQNPAAWRQGLQLGNAATRNTGLLAGQVAPGDVVATLQTTVTNLGLNMGTSKLVDTVAQLASIPSPALYDRAEVRNDPLGNVEDGNGVWSYVGSSVWEWRGPLSTVVWDAEESVLRSPGLDLAPEARTGGVEASDGVGNAVRLDAGVQLGFTREPFMEITDGVGSVVRVGGGSTASAALQDGFTDGDRAWVAARAKAKAEAMKNVDLTILAGYLAGANLRLCLGQSFRAGSDNARLYASASQIALRGWDFNGWMIGDASRCVNSTNVYDLYGSEELNPLAETFVVGGANARVFSDAAVAAGDYPTNARGATPEVVTTYVFELLRARILGQAGKDISRYSVAVNVAKAEGSLEEISTGDGAARTIHGMQRFKNVVTNLDGAAPSTVGAGEVDPMNCLSINFDHGQHDEGLNQDYITPFGAWLASLVADMEDKWGQKGLPAVIMAQAGGSRYGGAAMYGRAQYASMLQDKGPGSAWNHVWISHVDYGLPSFHKVPTDSGHPNAEDGHLIQAGNLMKAVWHAACEVYLLVLRKAFFPPFVTEVRYRGRHWLAGVAVCFAPLRESAVTVGTDPVWLVNKGISFESESGVETAVTTAGVVEGYEGLIEGTCAEPVEGFRTFKAAKGGTNHPSQGSTNFRDSFAFDSPAPIEFVEANQTVYANAAWDPDTPGTGWTDNPATNGTSPARFLENMAHLIGTKDWGLFMLGDVIHAQPMPDITA